MRCARCGGDIPNGSSSCPDCGLRIKLRSPLAGGPPRRPSVPQLPEEGPHGQEMPPGTSNAHVNTTTSDISEPPPPGYQGVASKYMKDSVVYGGFWIRFIASLIDALVLSVVLWPIFLIRFRYRDIYHNLHKIPSWLLVLYFVGIAISYAYSIIMTGKFQATLGKMALGLRVVKTDLTPVGYGTAALREFSKILSALILYIGYIMAGFDAHKQALHDKIASTYVIKINATRDFEKVEVVDRSFKYKCPHCGKKVKTGATWCHRCGAHLE